MAVNRPGRRGHGAVLYVAAWLWFVAQCSMARSDRAANARATQVEPAKSGLRNAPPAPRGNTRAVRTGAQADGRNRPGYEQTRAEVELALSGAQEWLQSSDGRMIDVFCREYHSDKHATDVLARLGDVALSKKVNATKLVIRRAKLLGELADRLGLTPQARFKLGLTAAKTGAFRVTPVRSVERARAVAELLHASRALPPIEAEVVEPEPEATLRPPVRRK